jgi:hypothetical protein
LRLFLLREQRPAFNLSSPPSPCRSLTHISTALPFNVAFYRLSPSSGFQATFCTPLCCLLVSVPILSAGSGVVINSSLSLFVESAAKSIDRTRRSELHSHIQTTSQISEHCKCMYLKLGCGITATLFTTATPVTTDAENRDRDKYFSVLVFAGLADD